MNTWRKISRGLILSLSFSLFGAVNAGQALADEPVGEASMSLSVASDDGASDVMDEAITSESEEALSTQPFDGRHGCFSRCERRRYHCYRYDGGHRCWRRYERCIDRCRFRRDWGHGWDRDFDRDFWDRD